jgi:BirA family biotin operon repressor/biotin-[acetyl-CoA-carboxylase] ligase
LLRAKRLNGWKFRRQAPIGPYRPDFVCHAAGLIVEADGGQHNETRDGTRDAWLKSQGFRILRFWNNDILKNQEGVLITILSAPLKRPPRHRAAADAPLSPTLSPQGEREKSGASHA